tara:strand:+ start:777 stop:965 length:189 start_codon:yes stop_codon:yes gene_type:complete
MPSKETTEIEMMKCPICNGKGIQEETMKGYRRYKCWKCDGAKEVVNTLVEQETQEQENENDE